MDIEKRAKQFDKYENGEMSDEEIIDFFQELIDDGSCWKIEGRYGRTAEHLIGAGYCKLFNGKGSELR